MSYDWPVSGAHLIVPGFTWPGELCLARGYGAVVSQHFLVMMALNFSTLGLGNIRLRKVVFIASLRVDGLFSGGRTSRRIFLIAFLRDVSRIGYMYGNVELFWRNCERFFSIFRIVLLLPLSIFFVCHVKV